MCRKVDNIWFPNSTVAPKLIGICLYGRVNAISLCCFHFKWSWGREGERQTDRKNRETERGDGNSCHLFIEPVWIPTCFHSITCLLWFHSLLLFIIFCSSIKQNIYLSKEFQQQLSPITGTGKWMNLLSSISLDRIFFITFVPVSVLSRRKVW